MTDGTNDGSIFEAPTSAVAPEPEGSTPKPAVNNEYDDILAQIKTADGRQKYTDLKTALASIPHAQQHISGLEQEMATLREQLATRKAAEEVMASLDASNPKDVATPTPAITEEQIAALVDRRLSAKEQASVTRANVSRVTEEMARHFGDKAEEMFYGRALEAGLSTDLANKLAATSPEAVFRIVGINRTDSGMPTRTAGSVNTETFSAAPTTKPSAKIPPYANTKDLVSAWKAAGQL